MKFQKIIQMSSLLVFLCGCATNIDKFEGNYPWRGKNDRLVNKIESVSSNPSLRDYAEKKGLLIGTCVPHEPLISDEEYRNILKRDYNIFTPENALRFERIRPEKEVYDFSKADELIEFAEANNMKIRGHPLVYHKNLPDWLMEKKWTKEELTDILKDHIQTVVGRYKGRIYAWDVVNEAQSDCGMQRIINAAMFGMRNNIWKKVIGPEYIEMAFRFAHEADPDALLFYNDYGAEGQGCKADAVYGLVKNLVENDVPIHGVGLQSHYFLDFVEPKSEEVKANMERLTGLGLEVHITEMDVSILDIWPFKVTQKKLQKQAEIYRNMLKTCLSVDGCNSFTMWGLSDNHSWIPQAFPSFSSGLIFDKQYQPKPAYNAILHSLSQD